MENKTRGKFIVFEYVDGGDPKLFIDHILDDLLPKEMGVWDREPTAGLFGSPLQLLLNTDSEDEVPPWRQLTHGFLADRFDHINKKKPNKGIESFLNEGKTFICDRYNLSTYAYQLPSEKWFEWYYACSAGLLIPNLTIFLKFDLTACVAHTLEFGGRQATRPSLLSRKIGDKENHDKATELRISIQRTEEMYLKAIDFLNKRDPSQKIVIVEVKDEFGAWFHMKPIIQQCLHAPSDNS